MQEEIEQRTLVLIINAPKLTYRVLSKAIGAYLAHRKEIARYGPVPTHGKQSLRRLQKQRQPLANVDISGAYKREFERIARKYGIDYAIKVDPNPEPAQDGKEPMKRYLVFYRARDNDSFVAAFQEFERVTEEKKKGISVLEKLRRLSKRSAERDEPAEQVEVDEHAPDQSQTREQNPSSAAGTEPKSGKQPKAEQPKRRKHRERAIGAKKEAITR